MFSRGNRRSGFTLPEVLVTVAIVAVLAAMVVPAVTQQLSKADSPSFLGSVTSLRTTIASFASDVRQLPGEFSQLETAITTSDTKLAQTRDSVGAAFTTVYVNRWRGPYETQGSSGVIPLGMGWSTDDDMIDSLGTGYIVAQITLGTTVVSDAIALDAAVDGGNGANAGMIRWDATATPALTPVNKAYLFLMSSAR